MLFDNENYKVIKNKKGFFLSDSNNKVFLGSKAKDIISILLLCLNTKNYSDFLDQVYYQRLEYFIIIDDNTKAFWFRVDHPESFSLFVWLLAELFNQ